MAIPENQLEIWSKQGAIATSANTYASIKTVLEKPKAPYNSQECDIFLQGSYANDTNVFSESDVDIVIKLNSIFYRDISALTSEEKRRYLANAGSGSYSYDDFKGDVASWLFKHYNGVTLGAKAIFVPGDGTRRDADVLAATQFRRYTSYNNQHDYQYAEGICFFVGGSRVENFPKQHRKNCIKKHQDTGGRFKRLVRVAKNMRNQMVAKGYLAKGVAPSYFLEGMLYNVPDDCFETSLANSFASAYNWLSSSDESKLVCANCLHWLLRDNRKTSWNAADFQTYMSAAKKFWNDW